MEFDRKVLLLAGLVALLAFAYLLLNSVVDKGKLFLSELEAYKARVKLLQERGYYYEGVSIIDEEEAKVYVLDTPQGFWVKKETPLFSWELISVNGTQYVCLNFTERACSEVRGSTARVAESLSSLLLREEQVDQLLRVWRVLYSANAMEVREARVNDTSAFFSITYSFSKLSVEKLKEIGFSPNMPIAKLSNITMNATFENHLLVDREVAFEEPYPHYERFAIAHFEEAANLSLPEVEANETAFYDQYYRLDLFLEDFSRQGRSKAAITGLAVSHGKPELCIAFLEGEEQRECIDAYIAFTGEYRACSLLEDSNACYYSVAVGMGKEEICDRIANLSLKGECFAHILSNTSNTSGG